MVIHAKRHHERAIPQQPKQCVLRPWEAREQIHRLREYRLADEERRVQFLDAGGSPEMMSLRPIEESDKRSGINDGLHHARSP